MELIPLISSILPLNYDLSFLITFILFVAIFFGIFLLFGIWIERKIVARMQSRYGPTYIGPFGILVNIADFIKFMAKEDLMPIGADKALFKYTPLVLATIPFLILLLLPYSSTTYLINPEFSIILPIAFIALAPSIILLSGWSQNNKYSYIGALRSAAQQLAYEIPLLLSIASVILFAGTFDLVKIVEMQKNTWFIFLLPLSFFIFLISSIAASERIPFDLPFAENELVAGWKTEYSGIRYLLTLELEYGLIIITSLISSMLFLGGWNDLSFLPNEITLLVKSFIFIFIFFLLRAAYPRFRIDQLLKSSWKFLIPLSLINLFLALILKVSLF